MSIGLITPVPTAHGMGLIACTTCGRAAAPAGPRCPRCGDRLHARPPAGLQPVWAWLAAGILLYVPANIWPMLITRTLGREEASTIVGGAIELAEAGAWGVAFVVFFASVVIPVAKFVAIGYLAWAVRRARRLDGHKLLHLYHVVEFIGRWSMIDIFVVAILSALVQLGFVASIAPGPAAAAFALSVAFTMLAARAFDARLIWDRIGALP